MRVQPPGGRDGLPFLQGGGEMGRRMRSHDWSRSPLGDPAGWPNALKTVVSLMLGSKFPMFLAWGEELGFLYNDAYVEILGQKHPDALGRPFQAIWPEIWPDLLPLVERALAGEATFHQNLPLTMQRKGHAEQTWFTFSYSPVRAEDGSIPGMFCACTETTAAVLAEQNRVEELENLRALFAQAPGFIAVLRGPDHVFELANDSYQQLVGRRDLIGRPLREALPEVEQQGFRQLLDHVYQTGKPFVGSAMRIDLQRTPGGPLEERFVDFVYQPIRTAAGTVDGIFAQGHDVTERVRALHELQQSDRRKDEFLAMLAHELRNPMAPIQSAAQLLQRGMGDADACNRAGQIIGRQVRHMSKLVDELLDVSRVTRGLITLEHELLDVDQVVTNAVEQVREALRARHHRLVVQAAPEATWVRGDRTRLVQVLANLLSNAIKFTPDGGEITVSVEPRGDTVGLRVRDTGMGISAEVLPYVFELFAQGERAPDRAEGGLGLGLALVRSLVSMHGGTVSAHSDGPGTGTEVRVCLPRASAGAPQALEPATERSSTRGALRMLVVDDNQDAAAMLADLLRSEGHEVSVAPDAHTALDRVRTLRPEVLVLDIGLPDLDGYALARQLRTIPETEDALLMALTGYGQQRDRERAAAVGFDHHLVKPVDILALSRLLDDFVRRNRSRPDTPASPAALRARADAALRPRP